jgi:hypothetical protein
MDNVKVLVAHAKQNHMDESDLDELVQELKAEEAATINNGGLTEQITYIIEKLGPTGAMEKIDKLLD